MVYDQNIDIGIYKITYEIPTEKEGECGGGSNVDDDSWPKNPLWREMIDLRKINISIL